MIDSIHSVLEAQSGNQERVETRTIAGVQSPVVETSTTLDADGRVENNLLRSTSATVATGVRRCVDEQASMLLRLAVHFDFPQQMNGILHDAANAAFAQECDKLVTARKALIETFTLRKRHIIHLNMTNVTS
jgi:hypothetical protein